VKLHSLDIIHGQQSTEAKDGRSVNFGDS
jgi:hypothetical protein